MLYSTNVCVQNIYRSAVVLNGRGDEVSRCHADGSFIHDYYLRPNLLTHSSLALVTCLIQMRREETEALLRTHSWHAMAEAGKGSADYKGPVIFSRSQSWMWERSRIPPRLPLPHDELVSRTG